MHEAHTIAHLFEHVFEDAAQLKSRRITRICLKLGELCGFDDQMVRLHFEAISDGTILEGACLEIETIPAQLFCPRCQVTFDRPRGTTFCPTCKELGRPTPVGQEFEIVRIEAEP